MKALLVKVSCLAGGLVAAILLAEVLTRLGAFGPPAPDMAPNCYAATDDAVLAYGLQPNWSGTAYGAPVSVSSAGHRGDDVPVPRTTGRTRILVLGDSVAFGYGVSDREAFPAVLERLLSDAGQDVEVINGAVTGYNAVQSIRLYETRLSTWKPDIVLLCIVGNDSDDALWCDSDGYLHHGDRARTGPATRTGQAPYAARVPLPGRWWLRRFSTAFRTLEVRRARAGSSNAASAAANASGNQGIRGLPSGSLIEAIRAIDERALRLTESVRPLPAATKPMPDPGRPRWVQDWVRRFLSRASVDRWAQLADAVRSLDATAASSGSHLGVLLYPGTVHFGARIRTLLTAEGILHAGLDEILGPARGFMARWSLGWDSHPNPSAHERIAEWTSHLMARWGFPAGVSMHGLEEKARINQPLLALERLKRVAQAESLVSATGEKVTDTVDGMRFQVHAGAGRVDPPAIGVLLPRPAGVRTLTIKGSVANGMSPAKIVAKWGDGSRPVVVDGNGHFSVDIEGEDWSGLPRRRFVDIELTSTLPLHWGAPPWAPPGVRINAVEWAPVE